MIQKIILINSANFNFLEVNLEKDLFFLGDNGSGKTTVIRAIHYLFSGDVRNLGIPSDKDGFKEYYFRYPNSYMICVFESFFIFMYKAGGEIVKLFSKQKFDIARVIDEESNLYELDAIKRYAKTPNMKKTVKSLSEYRDIIYGNDKRYLDFKFTTIKNSSVFIGLFNEIFNIDKSIIDSKSIKKAIQTTLNSEKKVLEFEHDKYLQDIYIFQSQYKFFREFEKQKENIDGAYSLKNSLLAYEEKLRNLLSYILFVSKKEQMQLEMSKAKYGKLEKNLTGTKRVKEKHQGTLNRCDEKYRAYINSLTVEIQEIQKLKKKFSKESVLEHKDRADRYEQTQSQFKDVQEQYIRLKKGFENKIESIESEIKKLHYKKDKELPRELENKKENKRKYLKEQVTEQIEREELAFVTQENIARNEIEDIQNEIKVFEKDIETEKDRLNTCIEESKQYIKSLNEEYEREEKKRRSLIAEYEEFIDTKRREIKELEFHKEELERERERTLVRNEETYNNEKRDITNAIEKYTRMIEVKPNSFKEFLNEEADGWESEFYPFMDETLLDRSLDELKPSMINKGKLLSIDMQTETLKKILTKDEATQKIEEHKLKLEDLTQSYEKSNADIESKFQEKREEIEQKILFLESDRETKKESIEKLEEEIEELLKSKEKRGLELAAEHSKQRKRHQNSIGAFEEEIKNSKDVIAKIEEGRREDKRTLRNRIKDLEEECDDQIQKEYNLLQRWLEDETAKVDELIKHQEQKKSSTTQDERIKELDNSCKELEKELSFIIKSQHFLEEYEDSKEKIASLLSLENELINIELRFEKFKSQQEAKIEEYSTIYSKLCEEKKVLLAEEQCFKKGVDAFALLEFNFSDIEEHESKKYLYELLESYNSIVMKYKSEKIDLKSKLDKLNRLKNSHNDIDIYFNFDEYDSDLYISKSPSIVAKIDEVYEYKNKKLYITKESGNKRFRNFVNNALPQNMSVFNDSEDKFLNQVAKINKNLSSVDFGVIKDIKLNPTIGDKKSIAKLLRDLNESVATLSSLLNETSLFYEQSDVLAELTKLETKFKEIKKELKGSAISLDDTIDLTLSFKENEKQITEVSQLKNESSTGGSMLLKIAIAISILQLFTLKERTPFFLIVDEVSRLHSDNQEKLRTFANAKGFGIVFVTPEPTYSKPEFIKYYRFQKNSDNEFESIELNI